MWRFSPDDNLLCGKFLHMTDFFSTSTAGGAGDKYQIDICQRGKKWPLLFRRHTLALLWWGMTKGVFRGTTMPIAPDLISQVKIWTSITGVNTEKSVERVGNKNMSSSSTCIHVLSIMFKLARRLSLFNKPSTYFPNKTIIKIAELVVSSRLVWIVWLPLS